MSDVGLQWSRAFGHRSKMLLTGQTAERSAVSASVEVHADPRSVVAEWTALANQVPTTPYQTADWLLPWIDTIGAETRISPMIVVARDSESRVLALLPLGLQRQGALTIASFLGAKHSNFNMGLFRPGPVWTRAMLHDVLRQAAAQSGQRVDLFALRNQPQDWQGVANPLMALRRQPSPSFAYKATLLADSDAFLKVRLSRETRKKLRQKMSRLRDIGPVEIAKAGTTSEIAEVLDAFVEQRRARNLAAGLPVDELPALRRFLDKAIVGDANHGGGVIALHALRCGGRVVATMGGAVHRDRFCGMLTSFAAEPDIARSSPGDLLLADVIATYCRAGVSTFDLGIGEARYKETYCPEPEALFDSLVPLTIRGHLIAEAERLRLQLKRSIKQSQWAWPLAQRLRRAVRPSSGRLANGRSLHQD